MILLDSFSNSYSVDIFVGAIVVVSVVVVVFAFAIFLCAWCLHCVVVGALKNVCICCSLVYFTAHSCCIGINTCLWQVATSRTANWEFGCQRERQQVREWECAPYWLTFSQRSCALAITMPSKWLVGQILTPPFRPTRTPSTWWLSSFVTTAILCSSVARTFRFVEFLHFVRSEARSWSFSVIL